MTTISEADKLAKHLSLLREEYSKLQQKLAEAEKRADIAEAARQTASGTPTDGRSFVGRLVKTVADLFEHDLYSDITVHLDGHQLRAHRFVLACRGDSWGVDLASADRLDFGNQMSYSVGNTLLKWAYTDSVDPKLGDAFILDLMRAARLFALDDLLLRCESMLIGRLDVKNCVKFYQIADEIDRERLKERCSELITQRWDDFSSEDFAEMNAPLLYKMLSSRTEFPMHSAIKLHREDVVFLYLVEFDSQLSTLLNRPDSDGRLPLYLALFSGQDSIARSLLSHKADVNAVDAQGKTCLIHSIEQDKPELLAFLLTWHADANSRQPDTQKTLLHLAAERNLCCKRDPAVLDGFLQHAEHAVQTKAADVNLQDSAGNTALHLALDTRNHLVFDLLMSSKCCDLALTNQEGDTPLWFALRASSRDGDADFEKAKQLLEAGASLRSLTASTGNDVLQNCLAEDMEEAALLCLQHDVNVKHANGKGETALHLAAGGGLTRAAQRLLQLGADPNAQTLEVLLSEDSLGEQFSAGTATVGRRTPLHLAIANRHVSMVRIFLAHRDGVLMGTDGSSNWIKPDLTISDSSGETALGFALWSGCLDIAEELIAGGANIGVLNKAKLALLHRAIQNQDAESSLFLIQHGADVNQLTPSTESPLQLAIKTHLPGVVRVLCKSGANTSYCDAEGNPPLWLALDSSQEDIASILVELGCDVDSWAAGPSGCRQTLLHRAIDENNQAVACFLIRAGADLNAVRRPGPNGEGEEEAEERQSPLHMAVTWGLDAVVKALLEHGADVNAQEAEGRTAVHLAVLNQHHQILTLLLRSSGLNLGLRDRRGLTPFAVAMNVKNNKAAQSILLKDSQTAYQTDKKGYNYLHRAVKESDLEAVLFLLSVHMDVNVPVQDTTHISALHLAVQGGNEMIVRNLLLAQANIHALTPKKQTALHLACLADQPEICPILLQHGIDFDALDDNMNNALHVACQKGSLGCAKELLTESKINADALNRKGQNPLHMLAQYGKENAAAIFEVFVETMPQFPVDRPDADGNTVLLLAYMNGNAQLCKAAVRHGVCMGTVNNQGISIFNHNVPSRQLLYKLLDMLQVEPRWAEGDGCSQCAIRFNITTRKHHCRHCGRLLCAKCSENQMPILKYDLQKPVRLCDTCYDALTLGSAI